MGEREFYRLRGRYLMTMQGRQVRYESSLYMKLHKVFQRVPWVDLRAGIMRKTMIFNTHPYQLLTRFCQDCGVGHPETIMILTPLWLRLYPEGGMACLPCMEMRMGRPVSRDDLRTDCTCNTGLFARLGSKTPAHE